MRFIIECDGVVLDIADAWYAAHCETAKAVGWSWLDRGRFWRLIRKEGRNANVLPMSKPVKLAEYQAKFAERIESDQTIGEFTAQDEAREVAAALSQYGEIRFITTSANVDARSRALERLGVNTSGEVVAPMNADVRRRPGEFKLLASGDKRTLVVASSDDLVRSAGEAELVTVGVSCGACNAPRLHQGGADVVYAGLDELVESLSTGAHDLIRAGLLPAPLG